MYNRLIYALKNGNAVHISQVERGIACGCVCPACGEAMVAKKGEKMMHHFAHHSLKNCEYGYESSLHLAAKDIFFNSKYIVLPDVYINFESYKSKILLNKSKRIEIDKVELEKREGTIIPDIVLYSGGKKLFVEIYVTHKIDHEKSKKIIDSKVSTIEIDLSSIKHDITKNELKEIVVDGTEYKKWVYNSLSEKWRDKFYLVADKKEVVFRGFAQHVDGCPINSRNWRGKYYANAMDDCLYCEYCIEYTGADILYCTGRQRIADVSDFAITYDERIKKSNKELAAIKNEMILNRKCPQCGGELHIREGKFGKFVGCSHYPHCRFTLNIDSETGEIK